MLNNFVFLLLIWVSLTNVAVFGAPEPKNTKQQKLEARSGKALYPCPHHAPQDNIYSLIQAQSEGRIVNKPQQHNANHALETAASNSLAQTVTLNSQIAVGGGSSNGALLPPPLGQQQPLPNAEHPPIFNGNRYAPHQQGPAPHLNHPNHYQQQAHQGQQYAASFTANRFANTQTNYQQQQQQNHFQQQHAYNYRPPLPPPPPSQQINNNHFAGGGGGGSNYAGSFSHHTHGQQNFNGISTAPIRPVPSVVQNSLDGQLSHIIQNTFSQASLDPHAEKHIYVHVPPEDLEEKSVQHAQFAHAVPPPQKHYKIIFIKAPTYQNQQHAAQLAAAAAAQKTEEKTLIYVLVKKPEEPSLEELQQIQETSIKHHKPEVYFIKYKTRKEGEELQNQLLQQGNLPGLGGPDAAGGIDIRLGNGESHSSSSSVSTSNSYATAAVSTPASHQPDEFYGVPIQ